MKNFIRKALFAGTIFILLFYLPGLFVYQVSPLQSWPMGLLSIIFFYFFTALLVCTLGWLFFNKKISLVLLTLLIAAVPILKNVWAFHRPAAFQLSKRAGSIRIMQWNCQGLPGIDDYIPGLQAERVKAVQFIRKYQPDIICIQDFSDTQGKGIFSNLALLRDTLHYPYIAFDKHFFKHQPWGDVWTGIAICSRIPACRCG